MIREVACIGAGFVLGYITGAHAVLVIEGETMADRNVHESGDLY